MSARIPSLLLVLVLALGGTGCVHTSTLPASRLDTDEFVFSGGINAPSVLYIPEAFAQGTYGLGGGDVSLNGSIGPGATAAGIAARHYTTRRWNTEVQIRGGEVSDERLTLVAAGGLQRVPTREHGFYYGGQVGLLYGREFLKPSDRPQTLPLVGGTIGLSGIQLASDWRMQIELDAAVPPTGEEDGPSPPVRLSLGVVHEAE